MVALTRKQLRDAEKASSNWVSMLRSGATWPRGLRPDFDPAADQFPSLSRNGWQQKASDVVENNFLARGPHSRTPSKPSSVPRRDRWQAFLFTSLPLSAETTFPVSGVQGTVTSSPLATFAPVFDHLPMWPTTRLSWPPSRSVSVSKGIGAPGDSRWKVQLPAPAGRQAEGSQRMCWCRTWISFLSDRWTTAAWKSSLMASHCSGERNWPLTPPWCLPLGATEQPGGNHQRSSFGPSQEAEGAHLPRAGSATRSRPVGGLGLRGGGTLVR